MSIYPRINLAGASVLVTGAAQGIGLATAKAFSEAGAQVTIGDLNLDLARAEADAIDGLACQLDVSDQSSFRDFVRASENSFGPVSVLVNNAGVMPNGGFLELPPEVDRLTMEVNLFGVVNGMRAVLPGMIDRGRGHVVNIASLAGKFPVKGLAIYNASKYAVVGLTAAARLEYAGAGISLSAVLPSAVDTALASGLDMKPIPKVQPADIAAAVVDSVHNRRAEIAVPGYVGSLATVASLTPEPLLNLIRQAFKDDRALHPDKPERADYRTRLQQQTNTPEKKRAQ